MAGKQHMYHDMLFAITMRSSVLRRPNVCQSQSHPCASSDDVDAHIMSNWQHWLP
jgi:hypothetical protein